MSFSGRGGASADHHVGQAKECVELMPVPGQSPIPHFPMPENIFHDVERMFNERPHRVFGPLDDFERCFLRAFGHAFDYPAFARYLPVYLSLQRHDFGALLHTRVSGVGVDLGFLGQDDLDVCLEPSN